MGQFQQSVCLFFSTKLYRVDILNHHQLMRVINFYFWFEGGDEDIQDCAIGCSRTDWTPSMERCLIDIMLEEVRRGNNIYYVLNSPAWIDMLVLFKERFGIQFDKDYLKSCCKGLEKLYHDLRYILEQRGFSWDETKQMITAYDGVWDAYIKVCYTALFAYILSFNGG